MINHGDRGYKPISVHRSDLVLSASERKPTAETKRRVRPSSPQHRFRARGSICGARAPPKVLFLTRMRANHVSSPSQLPVTPRGGPALAACGGRADGWATRHLRKRTTPPWTRTRMPSATSAMRIHQETFWLLKALNGP